MQKSRVLVWSKRILIAALVLLVLAIGAAWLYLRGSLAQLDGARQAAGLDATASVARDAHGVPVISGGSRADVAYATGFVHAQERYFQMDLLRRVAAGELSELFGERALAIDKSHRLHRFRARAELAVKALPAAERALLERYAAGVNDGLNALSTRPFEYALAGLPPRAWSPADTLLAVWAMYFDLQGNLETRELARGWFRDNTDETQRAFLAPDSTPWDAPLDAHTIAAAEVVIPAAPPAWWGKRKSADAPSPAKVAQADFLHTVGSNNWAVAGSRSDTGAAIIADDMHLGIQLPAIWYRAVLQFPDGKGGQRRMVGVTLPGTPFIVVGSNGHVAWGFTNSYGDYLDLIEIDGKEKIVTHDETILVKGAPAYKLAVRETPRGPIREVRGRSYAVHWAAHLPGAVNLNVGKLELADTLDEALAIAPTLGIPAQNFVGGDSSGNIGWTIAGPLPRRAATGSASTYPLKPYDAAGLWQGWLPASEYPRIVNPADGHIATANSRQLSGAGAALIGDGGFDLGARTHQVRDSLAALGAKTDVKKVYAIGLDDRAVFLAAWRERAITALDAKAVAGHAPRDEALALLKDNWTGRASVDSAGYRITRGFMYALYDIIYENANAELAKVDPKASIASVTSRWPVVLARVLDQQPDGWLPPQYANWQELQLAALDRVIADLTRNGQPLKNATWGQRNTAASAHPMASAIPLLGKYLKVAPDMLAGDQHMPRVAGPTFGQSERLTVSPGREEQGIFNMPGGQSGHPLSPYFLDGRTDWLTGRESPLLPGPAQHTLTFVK